MTKVFVHGNPETTAVWSELVAALRRRGVEDIELLSPPGFGAEVPAGFGSTRIEYRDWLIRELTAIGGEIDLVGHDPLAQLVDHAHRAPVLTNCAAPSRADRSTATGVTPLRPYSSVAPKEKPGFTPASAPC